MDVHSENITGAEVVLFLRHLLRHLRGPVELRWVGGSIYTSDDVKVFLRRHPKLTVHRFPAHALELNPDEFVWTKMQNDLANGDLKTFVSWMPTAALVPSAPRFPATLVVLHPRF